jgi:hypothetical protein
MEDSRPLDELADDLTSNHVLYDDTFHARSVHPIIQGCRAPRARHGRKPTADLGAYIGDDFAHQYVGPLRAAAIAALPCDFCIGPPAVRVEGVVELLLKCARSTAIATLGAAADHDLEAPRQQASSIAVVVRPVR